MIGSIEITIPAQTIDEEFPEHRQMIGGEEFITPAHTVKVVIPRQVILIGVKSKTQVDYRGSGTIYKFEEGNRDAIYSSSDECGNTHVRGLYIWEKEPQHNEILMDWWEVSKEDAREVSVKIEKVRELFGDKLTTLDESTPTCVTVATDEEFGDRLAAVMIEPENRGSNAVPMLPEAPTLEELKVRFAEQFNLNPGHRNITGPFIRDYLQSVIEGRRLDVGVEDSEGIKCWPREEFRRAALSIMDKLAKQSVPAPTETPKPPTKHPSASKQFLIIQSTMPTPANPSEEPAYTPSHSHKPSPEQSDKYWGDMSARVVKVEPVETPEPPKPQKRRRKETMRDLFLLEVKEQFCEIFKCPIEEAKFHNVRHRLLNVVADWGNEGFIDALHLKEKGDEFWNQARRVMDKIERKAKQSA